MQVRMLLSRQLMRRTVFLNYQPVHGGFRKNLGKDARVLISILRNVVAFV